ncbi:MAG: DUF4827 domain-containing protein [Muribaculaceae bacterium]|nr:DUF4827 domain-containing protein [Muribaculaceae bacterium]MDE6645594.1 DUF4827 domain-containing protein [Muribaculaceae bacterium]
MIKSKSSLFTVIALLLPLFAAMMSSSCSKRKSYAELLNDENYAVNAFLANHRVINSIPADSVFEYGENAPYYRLNEEGTLYMQVLDPGTRTDKAVYDELIYFRFMRTNLSELWQTGESIPEGNDVDMSIEPTSFRYQNFTLQSYTTYGTGIQEPLKFLGIDCRVNLVVKSQLGLTSEIASVVPFLYNLRYFRAQT